MPHNFPKLTVAVCTWNRSSVLEKTLSRMCSLRNQGNIEWELIVVDNNSTDCTRNVISKFASRLPIKYLFEEKQGQCFARNLAIEQASGEWIIWTDDDVLVDVDWLVFYAKSIRSYPKTSFGGGPITPWFPTTPPSWISENLDLLEGPFAIKNLGAETRLLKNNEMVFGANMAIRTDILKRNRFDSSRGLVANNNARGDEIELIERLRSQGLEGFWCAESSVKHYILPSRLTKKYIFEYFQGHGATIALDTSTGPNAFYLIGIPRWLIRKIVEKRVALMFSKYGSRNWVENIITVATLTGLAKQFTVLRNNERK